MKAEVGRGPSAQNGQLMLKSDKLELERGAARLRKRKTKIDKLAKRIATMTVTVRPTCKNHQSLSAL